MANILIIEDETGIRSVLRMQFELAGHKAEAVGTANEALHHLINQKPDLVILDVMLPGIDGEELCRAIRRSNGVASVPILAMSADHSRRKDLMAAGADGFIDKPYTLDQMAEAIQLCLQHAQRGDA